MCEYCEEFLEKEGGYFVQRGVAVAAGMGCFSVQRQEKLYSCQHDGQFFRLGPFHEFRERFDPRLNAVLLDHFTDNEGKGSDCPEITMLRDDYGQ